MVLNPPFRKLIRRLGPIRAEFTWSKKRPEPRNVIPGSCTKSPPATAAESIVDSSGLKSTPAGRTTTSTTTALAVTCPCAWHGDRTVMSPMTDMNANDTISFDFIPIDLPRLMYRCEVGNPFKQWQPQNYVLALARIWIRDLRFCPRSVSSPVYFFQLLNPSAKPFSVISIPRPTCPT